MAKQLSMASSRIWINTADPGVSENSVETGNLWQNSSTNTFFLCHDATLGAQIWKQYPQINTFASFTPVIAGTSAAGTGTYTTQLGRYVQIGTLIMGTINLVWTATTGTGNTLITGLPVSANAAVTPIVNFQFEGITLPVGGLFLNGKISGTQISIISPLTAAVSTALALPAAGTLQTSFCYSS